MNAIGHDLYAARKEYSLTPGATLDTKTSIQDCVADVLFVPEAAKRVVDAVIAQRPTWDKFYQSADLSPAEKRIVNRHLGEISLVSLAAEQVLMDVDNSDEIKLMEEELYDHYRPDLFRHAVAAKANQIAALAVPDEYEATRRSVLERLAQYIPTGESLEIATPTEKTLSVASEWIHDQFGDVIDEIDHDPRDEFDAPAIVEYLKKSVASTPALRDTGWDAELIVRQKSAISTSFFKKKLVVPTQRTVTPKELKKLNIHEAFGHAMRSARAETLGMTIGQYGTANYARFEESFMIALEQCMEGTYDPMRGADHYIAVGLSVTEGMSKDEIADLMGTMSFLKLLPKNDSDTAKQKATKLTNAMLNRTFIGMTDVDDGIAHRKDIDYYHGLNDAWRLLNYAVEHTVLNETMDWVLSAKFNPFDAEDREYVERYVPMPPALEGLFSPAA